MSTKQVSYIDQIYSDEKRRISNKAVERLEGFYAGPNSLSRFYFQTIV